MGVLEIENKLSDFAYFENEELTEYSIHESVTEIGFSAFANAKNLKHIKFPSNLKKIGDSSFMNTDLVDLTIPAALKEIGIKAFSGCTKLKKIVIPEGVTSIGASAFADCTSLEEVYLPNSLTTLEPQLFLNCKNLKKIHLPNDITSLPDEFFKGCEKLDVELSESIKSLGQGVFNGCKNLTKYPNHVENVSPYTFKGCKRITSANISENITNLPDHLFDTCVNLSEVIINKPVTLGKGVFRNCVSLKDIPENISSLGNFSFENCKGLTKIEIKTKTIPKGCFRACVNLSEISDFYQVNRLGAYALSNTGFKVVDLSRFKNIPSNVLSNSKHLESVLMENALNIRSHAFYKCPKLKYTLPDYLEKVHAFAFAYNEETKELILPNTLKRFDASAFSNSKIEHIVNYGNPNYIVLDDVLVISQNDRNILLYAVGNEQEEFDISKYVEYDNQINPIYKIYKYAFAGAKNLRKITLPSTITHIDVSSFMDNPDLKTLVFKSVDAFPSISLGFYEDDKIYLPINKNLEPENKYSWPFEKLVFTGKLVYIQSSVFGLLNNVEEIDFDTDSFTIGNYSFYQNKFKKIILPEGLWDMGNYAFPKDCIIDIGDGIELKNIMRMSKDTQSVKYRIFILEEDKYLIAGNGRYVRLSKDDMLKFTNTRADLIEYKPTQFLDYFYILEEHNLTDEEILRSGVLMGASKDALKTLFNYYYKNDVFFKRVLKYSGLLEQNDEYTDKIIKKDKGLIDFINYVELLRKYNITNPILYSRIFACECNLADMEIILKNYFDLFINILKKANIINFNPNDNERDRFAKTKSTFLIKNNKLVDYVFMILKYDYRDSFLFSPELIGISKTKFANLFFDNFDNNLKRLLISAGVIASEKVDLASSITNLEDLINLIYILGGFESDPIIKQRALTFITEKMTMDLDKKKNTRKVVANDIHRMFNFSEHARDEFDYEFSNFFLENYEDIYDEEIKKSGFIERVYKNFRKISETSSSNKGVQRHLKVTMDKVLSFLLINKFKGVTKKLRPLAAFLGEWYDNQEVWDDALIIMKEMKNAPRNIFISPITNLETGEFISYDNDSKKDLKEESSDKKYYYEWLPKHSYDNFILGKYCSCCAHLNGAGAGIMRASIILDNVQNLVIRNETGKIIAKSTLYINRNKGYGVFNNVEISLAIKSDMTDDLRQIYEAFMRGANAFVGTYNKNFDIPIKELTVGYNRNRIIDEFAKNDHKEVKTKETMDYGKFALGTRFGHYYGDSKDKQLLVLSKRGVA